MTTTSVFGKQFYGVSSLILWGLAAVIAACQVGTEPTEVQEIFQRHTGISIQCTAIPHYGSTDNLAGRVSGVAPQSHYVAVYIFVDGAGWWIKPYFASPHSSIQPDGSWSCDITTGGDDVHATRVQAFLLPDSVEAPLIGGQSYLPIILDSLSLARALVTRTP